MLTQKKSVLLIVILLASLVLVACQSDTSETQSAEAVDVVLPPPVVHELDDTLEPAESAARDAAIESGQLAQDAETGPDEVALSGNGPGVADHLLLADSVVEPNPAEVEALMYMREEEKLARDVYLFLYEQWGQPIFQNIAASEQAHMDSVLGLLNLYGLSDPASAEAGVFTNSDLQALYDQLVDQGSLSAADALKVGALIEEVDILDLEQRLTVTTNAQIVQAFNNLLRGSGNHLRAFVTNLERLSGESYQPQVMSLDAYQAVMSGSFQPGGYGNGGAGAGNGAGAAGRGGRGGNGGSQGQTAG